MAEMNEVFPDTSRPPEMLVRESDLSALLIARDAEIVRLNGIIDALVAAQRVVADRPAVTPPLRFPYRHPVLPQAFPPSPFKPNPFQVPRPGRFPEGHPMCGPERDTKDAGEILPESGD